MATIAQKLAAQGAFGSLTKAPAPRLAALGDSITAECLSTSTGGANFNAHGYLTWAATLGSQRFNYTQSDNFGVASDTLALMSARVPAITSGGYGICVIEGGTNDIGNNNSFSAMAGTMTTAILSPLMKANVVPVCFTIWPRSGLTSTQAAILMRYNTWLRELGFGRADLLASAGLPYPPIVVDIWPYWDDAAAGSLAPIANYTRDGVHETQLGAYWAGKALSEVLATVLPPRPTVSVSAFDLYDATNNIYGNQAIKTGASVGTFAGTGGSNTTATSLTPTGSVATGWAAQRAIGSSTATLVSAKENPRTDGPNTGERQRMTVTASSAGAVNESYLYQMQSNLAVTAGWQLVAECSYELVSATNLSAIQLNLFTGGGGLSQNAICGSPDTTNVFAVPGTAHKGVLRTPILTAASGNTALNVQVGVVLKTDGGSAAADIYFGDLAIRRLA